MSDEVSKSCNGKKPYEWQLDLAEALYLGLDSVVIAGTGAGKTLPFAMPLLADTTGKSKIIIVSTLNELEHDQVRDGTLITQCMRTMTRNLGEAIQSNGNTG